MIIRSDDGIDSFVYIFDGDQLIGFVRELDLARNTITFVDGRVDVIYPKHHIELIPYAAPAITASKRTWCTHPTPEKDQ